MNIDIQDLRKRFRENQYKMTPQRLKVLEVFTEHPDSHLSAEEVFHLVRVGAPEIGLATVYRTLEMLNGIDILQRIEFGDGRSRYEMSAADSPHSHHHLICRKCGEVKEFEDDLLETVESFVSRKTDFQITDHQVKFYGFCKGCQSERGD